MKVTVNGDAMELEGGTTLTDLLEKLQLRRELVVVELNQNILKKEELPTVSLKEGDRLEIVHFVGGGAWAWKKRSRS